MKYIFCALALLLLLALGCCMVLWRIEGLVEDLDALLVQGADTEALALWERNGGFLRTVLRHNIVDELDEEFATLPDGRAAIRSKLQRMVEMERAYYYNLM